MSIRKRVAAAAAALAMMVPVTACGGEKTPDFSNIGYIAELTTMECYYHNTADLSHEGSWFFNHGYKKSWIEYSGIVRLGIDVGKVSVSSKGKRGDSSIYVIKVPQARVIGEPDVDEKSFSTPLEETGFLTDITANDKTRMYNEAQQSMLKVAESDENLLSQARVRAKNILEQFVRSMCEEIGETNVVIEFEDVK